MIQAAARGIDTGIERFVALTKLLPLEALEAALVLDRHQLLGDELLAPLAVGPARQVDGAGRMIDACGDLFVRRTVKPQKAIGLGLEGRDRDRPEPGTAAQPLAIVRCIDIGGPRDRACPVEALDALDGSNLGKSSPPGPGIDSGRFIARIDGQLLDLEVSAGLMAPGPVQDSVKL